MMRLYVVHSPIVAKALYSLVLIILLCSYSLADFLSCANILLPAIKIPMANILDIRFIFLYLITISANFVECIISYTLIINSCNK